MKIQFTVAIFATMLAIAATAISPTSIAAPSCTAACYVSPTGNDANSGLIAAPLATIQIAINQVNVGGTVFLAAGTYTQATLIDKNITLTGAGQSLVTIQGVGGVGNGFSIVSPRSNTILEGFTVTGFYCGISFADTNPNSNVTCNAGANGYTNITLRNLTASNNTGSGIQVSGNPSTILDGLLVSGVTANNNGSAGKPNRGIYLLGDQRNVTIENSTFNNNLLVGIDFNSAIRSGTIVRNNTIIGNGDSGIGLIGVVETSAAPVGGRATLVENNTVTDNGRFGIEMKNPSGNGLSSGAGSVVVRGNRVTRTLPATDLRDYAGIMVFRRSVAVSPGGANEPTGVWLENNFIAGYIRNPAAPGPGQGVTRDAFGMVIEGTNHTIINNLFQGNNIGLQIQSGGPGAPGDSTSAANTPQTPYFDRGNAQTLGSITVTNNGFVGNTDFGLRKWETGGAGTTIINASQNFWNAPSGPAPIGTGDAYVSGAPGNTSVIVTNWLSSPSPIVSLLLGIVPPEPPAPAIVQPTPFTFTTQRNVPFTTLLTSNTVTIAGLSVLAPPATISIDGGEYSIGCTGTFVSTVGSIRNGDTVCVRHLSADTYYAVRTTTLNINGFFANFSSVTILPPTLGLGNGSNSGVTFDSNQDGLNDFILQRAGQTSAWISTNASSTLSVARSYVARAFDTAVGFDLPRMTAVGYGDIDNAVDIDGLKSPEVVWRDADGGIYVTRIYGSTVVEVRYYGQFRNQIVEGIADIDGDGFADIILRNTQNGDLTVWFMRGLDINEMKPWKGGRSNWRVAGFGDLNGDGRQDVIWQNTDGVVVAYMTRTNRQFDVAFIALDSREQDIKFIVDITGDNKADIVMANKTGRYELWTMNGTTISNVKLIGQRAATDELNQSALLNFDRVPDLVFVTANRTVEAWIMSASGAIVANVVVGTLPMATELVAP
jgi:parallel beta-helix repeat protein